MNAQERRDDTKMKEASLNRRKILQRANGRAPWNMHALTM